MTGDLHIAAKLLVNIVHNILWFTYVSRIITFPERLFLDSHFLGKTFPGKMFPGLSFSQKDVFQMRRFPYNRFPGKHAPIIKK